MNSLNMDWSSEKVKRIHLFFWSFFFIALTILFTITTQPLANKGRQYYEQTGQILWDIDTSEKIVALTFDDGPHAKYTSEVLDILEKYEAKGTFFLVGELAENNPEVVWRMYEDGHELANHTYTHPFRTTIPKLLDEIKQTNETIYSITGYSPRLFRPVEGQYTDALIDAVTKEGYKVVMWSWHLDTEDWKDPGVNKIVKKVVEGTTPGDVILFHDGGGNREQTVKALEKIIPILKKEGYEFVTVTKLLKLQAEKNKP